MIKIDNVIGIDGVKRTLEDLETIFLELINRPAQGLRLPILKLQALEDDLEFQHEQRLTRFFKDNFNHIVLAKPEFQENLIKSLTRLNYYNSIYENGLTAYGERLLACFNYNYYQRERLVDFAGYLNIRSCPYCNSQYTFVVKENDLSSKKKFQYDHFYPQKKFPFLSISMYNLIPSCANCNLSKGDEYFTLGQFIHPYVNNFHAISNFIINPETELQLLMRNNLDDGEIGFTMTNQGTPMVNNFIQKLDLIPIYKRHNDIVSELYFKARAYNEDRIQELLGWEYDNGERIFPDRATLNRLLIGNYPSENDIHNRPISKFTIDIARQAGLID